MIRNCLQDKSLSEKTSKYRCFHMWNTYVICVCVCLCSFLYSMHKLFWKDRQESINGGCVVATSRGRDWIRGRLTFHCITFYTVGNFILMIMYYFFKKTYIKT